MSEGEYETTVWVLCFAGLTLLTPVTACLVALAAVFALVWGAWWLLRFLVEWTRWRLEPWRIRWLTRRAHRDLHRLRRNGLRQMDLATRAGLHPDRGRR